MASQPLKVYVRALWAMQRSVAQQLGGTDLRVLPLQLKTVLVVADIAVALVIQALVDAAVITDAQVQARLNAVAGATYAPLPASPRAPDDEESYTPPDLDLGA